MEKRTEIAGHALLIGGSAGSLEVLLQVVPMLRADLSYPIVIVLHRKPSFDPILIDLLARRTSLRVKEAEEKETMVPGAIYVAPGDYHLLFEKDHTFSLDYSEKINFSRPSIDVSFQSAADVFGPALVSIILSGANADGTEGSRYVKSKGGITIAQSPESAEVAFMPQQAILANTIDIVLPVSEMAGYLNHL